MSTPLMGQIIMFGGNFAIRDWAFCQGQLMSIAQNSALFALLGTTYGGDGQTTFALPDLRGRVPVSQGNLAGGSTYTLGQTGGVETVTLQTAQIPAHNHAPGCNTGTGSSTDPTGNVWANQPALIQYSNALPGATMMTGAIGNNTGGQPHNNIMPFMALNYQIALFGVFPSQN